MIGQTERLLELNRLKAQEKKPEGRGRIISFSSGKGGTGKTFISLNTAYALSRMGNKVLLIDLDSNLSNINIMLNMRPQKTILDFLLQKSALRDLITHYEPSLHFIFGESGKADYPLQSDHLLDYLAEEIKELCRDYDYIILDIGAGAGDEIIHILGQVHANIIVLNAEPTAIMDAYVIVKLMHMSGSATPNFAVINKCFSEEEATTAYTNLSKAAEHFLKEEVFSLGFIGHDQMVTKAIMAQELYIRKNPRSKTSLQIIKLAQGIVQKFRQGQVKASGI
ncbi:MAG: MinD/ParA family protein [Ignavibacteria bacterium]|jgi:flagellar biosynthesis protein FlhG|nr:MinD/ParA family protein [Ignavibacteria bacterium]MCU7503759.1 MinD/ParA family protein [Ignavibacteria bacterium]MCU7517227.1 MinD/ParA family protein [Ignavibacteria bacterium]